MPVGAERVKILLQMPEAISHASSHRQLDAFAVPFELLDHHGRDDQLYVTILNDLAQCVDQLLAVPALGQIEPHGRIHQHAQHRLSRQHTERPLSHCLSGAPRTITDYRVAGNTTATANPDSTR